MLGRLARWVAGGCAGRCGILWVLCNPSQMHVPAASTRTQPPSPSSPSLPLPQKINKRPEELSVVSVMPCVRKQGEADRMMFHTREGQARCAPATACLPQLPECGAGAVAALPAPIPGIRLALSSRCWLC